MRFLATGLLCALVLGTNAAAQRPETLLENLKPRAIGPALMGGRVVALAVYEEDPAIFYAASASGGLLKTVNGGTTWDNVFERESTVSIGDVAIDSRDPNVVWVGTGEANNRQSSSWGDGVYKSIDGGKSWRHMGLRETHHIGRIVVNPSDPDIVYIAAMGHLWGANRERGVFMTSDGGRTWEHVLAIDENTGANDLIMDPADAKVLYAATYQRRRSSWGFNGGGPHSAIYKTVDGGRTWRRLTTGIPEGDKGRMGFAIYREDPSIVYATVAHPEGGVFRSEDRGESWRKLNTLMPSPTYYGKIRIDPNDEKRVYVLGNDLYVSDDGGETFRDDGARGVHVDHHALWINPRNSRHLILATDGGIWVSRDRGATWEHLNNYPLGQFYHVSVDMQQPYWVYGGMQDNSTWGGPSAVRDRIGIRNQDWVLMRGGDGMYTVDDPSDYNTVYKSSQYGRIDRYDRKTGERKSIQPESVLGEPPLRWNWVAPIVVSSHDAEAIYIGANRVLRSLDRGHSWTVVSPDLTTQTDRDTLELMGVLHKDISLYRDQGVYWFGTITALAESTEQAGLMYAGTDDGNVHVTRDGGRSWTDLTSRIPVPKMLVVSRLTPSAFDEGTVYATFDGHRSDDFNPYVYASTDFGQSWSSITANLPTGSVYTIKEDPENPNVLYVGTEFGLFVSIDRGASWTRWPTLPTVAVHELVVHPRDHDLVVGTHGRSILIVDDISPIQQLTPTILASSSHLFEMRPVTQFLPDASDWFLGGREFVGPNPTFGAYVNYYLRASVTDTVTITITDAAGTVVRELTGPNQAGIHRVTWDLRTVNNGPFVLPGEYAATLSVGGQVHRKTIRVRGDPQVAISDADRKKLFDALMTATAMQSTADSATVVLNRLGHELERVGDTLVAYSNTPTSVKLAVEEAAKQVADLRTKLVGGGGRAGSFRFDFSGEAQPPEPLSSRIRGLKRDLFGSQSLPTAIQSTQLHTYVKELNDLVGGINTTISEKMPGVYERLAEFNIRLTLGEPIHPIQTVERQPDSPN